MPRITFFDNGKWRIRIGMIVYDGGWVDRFAAYENTGMEPDELMGLLQQIHQATSKCKFDISGTLEQDSILDAPWKTTMNLSTRAFNSLRFWGKNNPEYPLRTIRDVAGMDRNQIQFMRNAGPKTRKEISEKLRSLGIESSEWFRFL